MKISFRKINASNHELKIVKANKATEHIIIDTNTYLLHDVCHFYVERELKTASAANFEIVFVEAS